MRGLYIHIPYCNQKCHYCNFVISTHHSDENRKRFFSAFQSEVNHAREKYGLLKFDTFYLGGGTPSLISTGELSDLVNLLKSKFTFSDSIEFTCEVNPKDVTKEKVKVWRELGINRISLGAQAFQDSILEQLGRDHSAEDIRQSVQILRENNFENISFDLICRLPNQNSEDFEESVHETLKLDPAQITIYDLEVHEKTVFGYQRKTNKLNLPDEVEHLEMMGRAEVILEKSKLRRYEIANFAIPGFESKHNLIYWRNGEYLGLGPGAFSYINEERYQLANDVTSYLGKCGKNNFSCYEYDLIDDRKKELETLIAGIRLVEGVDLDKFKIIRNKLNENLEVFIQENLIISENSRIYLSARGRRVYEDLIERLIEV